LAQGMRRAQARAVPQKSIVAARRAIAKEEGVEPLPYVTLKNAAGDTAKVYPFGANVASYVKDGNEVLAFRKDATFDGKKPLSGGVPICFPKFGPGEGGLPQHGFARDTVWDIVEMQDGAEPKVVMRISDTAETRKMWDHPFEATYSVTLKAAGLETVFHVKNTGASSFDFTAGLHSYWSISHPSNIKIVGGFKGKEYIDKPFSDAETERVNTTGNEMTITEQTLAMYKDFSGDVTLQDAGKGSSLTVRSSGWSDLALWNPWGDEKMGYDQFVGIEPVQKAHPVSLSPSQEWTATMNVTPSAL